MRFAIFAIGVARGYAESRRDPAPLWKSPAARSPSCEKLQIADAGHQALFGGELVEAPEARNLTIAQAVFQIITQIRERLLFATRIAVPLQAGNRRRRGDSSV